MNIAVESAIVLGAAYLIGAIPTGIIIGRLWRGVDVRRYGSGGGGATNVLRTLGPIAGGTVLSLDMAKGAIVVLIAITVTDEPALRAAAGSMAVLGNMRPVYVGFKGGKGVATGLGALFVLSPIAGGVAAVGALIAYATRYVSIGSLIGATLGLGLMGALAAVRYHDIGYVAFAAPTYVMILFGHYGNLFRLLKGRENRLTRRARPKRANSRPT